MLLLLKIETIYPVIISLAHPILHLCYQLWLKLFLSIQQKLSSKRALTPMRKSISGLNN